jgi:hypothetical protein
MQDRCGRRGAVFSVRFTDGQRLALERMRRKLGGPDALGPWLVWRALEGRTAPATAVDREGNTATASAPGPVLPAQREGVGNTVSINKRLILDLCGGTGAWSKPYADAGYPVRLVTLPKDDVRTFRIGRMRPWGILYAPPCTEFSLAKNGHFRDYVLGMACVNACLRIIAQCRPAWWALENPVGKLSHWLGTPLDVFQPYEFGDPWTKRTALWGNFALPQRGPYVKPLGPGPLCGLHRNVYRSPSVCSVSAHRAITPKGFARAFYEANP